MKQKILYQGKSKTLYATDNPNQLIMEFRDDATAFNGVKKASLANKGKVNNHFNAFIMDKLAAAGVPTQFERIISDTESLTKHLKMIPVECVIRNIAAGNLCKRLGIEEGMEFNPPLFEFFLKNDALGDPMINENHILAFNWASADEIKTMQELSLKINAILKALFLTAGLLLVDFKLEFGRHEGKLYLGDEFTPDGCRIWDVKTREILDKDRFRKDLGNVIEGYQQVAQRLGISSLD